MIAFYRSTIGKKILMAVSGLIGVGFVFAHMIGNLQLFQGAEALNGYARLLHGPLAKLVWAQRVLLIGAVAVHVLMAVQLTRRAQQARPVGYVKREPQVSTLASRTMRIGGFLLLAFIVFHILHFTTLDIDPTFVPLDAYGNVVKAFQHPWRVAVYVVAMILLGLHLYHGIWSSTRTLGVAPPSPWPLRRKISVVLAVIIWIGFTIVPLAVFAGLVR
jgi:succinate dehydrogenase / fumarate reductase, cytochrome b subunit